MPVASVVEYPTTVFNRQGANTRSTPFTIRRCALSGYWAWLLGHPPRIGQLAQLLPPLHFDSGTFDGVASARVSSAVEAIAEYSGQVRAWATKPGDWLGSTASRQAVFNAVACACSPTAECIRAAA